MATVVMGAVAIASMLAMYQLVESPTPVAVVSDVPSLVDSQMRFDYKPVHSTADFVTKVLNNPTGVGKLQLVVSPSKWESNLPSLTVLSNLSAGAAKISRIPPCLT